MESRIQSLFSSFADCWWFARTIFARAFFSVTNWLWYKKSVTRIPSCSNLSENSNLLSVLSYNLLAPLYVRSVDQRTGEIQPFAAFGELFEIFNLQAFLMFEYT